jgi:hypothetical protein
VEVSAAGRLAPALGVHLSAILKAAWRGRAAAEWRRVLDVMRSIGCNVPYDIPYEHPRVQNG